MTRLVSLIVMIGLLSGDGTPAQAQAQSQSADAMKQKTYALMDSNGDGKVTREEFLADFLSQAESRYAQFLSRVDADRDGTVTREEFLAAQPPQR